SDPHLLDSVEETTLTRLRKMIKSHVDNMTKSMSVTSTAHPLYLSMRLPITFSDADLANFDDICSKLIPHLVKIDKALYNLRESKYLQDKLIEEMIKWAHSSDFDTVNSVSSLLMRSDMTVAEYFSEIHAFRILLGIYNGYEINAWRALDIVNGNFQNVQNMTRKAYRYIEANEEEALDLYSRANLNISFEAFKSTLFAGLMPDDDEIEDIFE
ncbi:MAG TPA: hypothetical protein ACFE0H_04455, partial [Elainellaceae cyanobacterium]